MKNIIVTGANSFVGSAFVKECLNHGDSICALVHNNHRDKLPDHPSLKIISCEMKEISKLTELIEKNYDTFYHFAWEGSSGPARADTVLQLNNVQLTVNALRTAKELGCERFLCAGSIMEDETIAAAYALGNKPGLGYIYGGAKMAAHMMCMSVAANIGIDIVWPKITNAYGVGEVSPRMVNTTLRKCIKGEAPQFTAGTQNYDFIYIDDTARALRMIGENGKPFHEYLIGSSTARPLKEFLLEMKAAVAPNLDFIFGDIPFTGINLPLERFDCSKTEEDTGFRAKISFAEGCKKTIEWLKSQE